MVAGCLCLSGYCRWNFSKRENGLHKNALPLCGSRLVANLSRLEEKGIGIYFTHPYTSCEKGTVECHNRMLRRLIPKGKSIDDYSADEIMIFADIMNALPRKLLGYHTPEELFDAELDRIYAV